MLQPNHPILTQNNTHNALLNPDKDLVFFWNPKAGSTLVCSLFFHHCSLHDEVTQYSGTIHEFRRKKYYDIYGRITLRKICDNTLKIKFVRNPYYRSVSSFYHCLRYLSKHKINLELSFMDYLNMISSNDLMNKNIQLSNHIAIILKHCSIQYNIIEDNFLNHIIKIENIENDLLNLQKNTGLNLSKYLTNTNKINTSESKYKYTKKQSDKDLSHKKFNTMHHELYNYENFLNQDTENLIYNIYQLDIRNYQYTR